MDPKLLGLYLVGLTQAVVFFRWLHRRMRDDEVNRAFIRDMATNHLPHLYSAMRQLANKAGFELEEPPPIQWIDFESVKKGRG